jgi:hypothetical protein
MTQTPNPQRPTTSFFKNIAQHNLERFHSECLAWLFNTEKKMAQEVIRMLLSKFEGYDSSVPIEFIHAFTEVQQLDLVLYFRSQDVDRALIIENKLKASEGSKLLSKQEKSAWNIGFKVGHIFSQTEYYHLRPIARKNFKEEGLNLSLDQPREGIWIYDSKSLPKTKNQEPKFPKGSEKWILIQKEACFPVYLIPAKWEEPLIQQYFPKTYDSGNYNTWRQEGLGKNPWKTTSYVELVKACSDITKESTGGNRILVEDYLAHLMELSATYQKTMNAQFEAYAPSRFGAYEYFKVIAAALTTKAVSKNPSLLLEAVARPGSSKSGDPILDIYLQKGFTLKRTVAKGNPKFNLGIQVQGKSIKLFIGADEYEKVEILKGEKGAYAEQFLAKLGAVVTEDGKNLVLNLEGKKIQLQRALPKGKSFMDYFFNLDAYFGEGIAISYPEFFHLLYSLSEAVSRSLIKE